MGEHARDPGEQLCAVRRDRRTRRVLLGMDQLGLRPRGGGAAGARRGGDAFDGTSEVDRGRAGGGELLGRPLQPVGIAGDLHRQAVAGGDPDERCAADREPPDRRRGVAGAVQLEPAVLRRR